MKRRLILYIQGLQMAFAFLTTLPCGSVSWNQKTARHAIFFFSVCGVVIGLITAITISVLMMSSLPVYIIAFFAIIIMIGLNGGLHLDGWMDVTDAAGSWQDKEKKIKIMKDSYTGAVAVWSTMLLLGGRFLFILYVIDIQYVSLWFLFVIIPVFSRTAMAHLLITAPLLKQEGLAVWFREKTKPMDKWMILTVSVMITGMMMYSTMTPLFFVVYILVAAILFYWIGRLFFYTMFGGVNGDTAGAMCEGMETILWLSSALFISFVMG
ncbi:adenosylcobinamide-GDP ribazoletransferase [Salibacterium salarium]|uniref:Adenosylcobinamide-GDP ribazoletransferase n=1 Tax=Salibacterium salarium TaxID=284579 RepID=A0A3R9QPB6_9BACI|nr:adenosylcobinamide-GDP ribazoletransferase [Salibacterium salarium]RSL34646.1 adenosylcobinamide-GDP ribazoletransferase [Salibacterium salarium]